MDELHPGAERKGGVGELGAGTEDTRFGEAGPVESLRFHRGGRVRQKGTEVDITADHRHQMPMSFK
eukprot:3102903-Prorocentrum_lima.AAC.1